MNLSPEERAVGRDNYYEAVGETRRDFLRKVVGAGAVSGVGLGAMYFGYGNQTDPSRGLDNPLRIGIIGTGDEGGVLIGSLNPNYVQVVAIADIRPYNIHRAFHGDATALSARPGLMSVYDWQTEDQAKKEVKVYQDDYHDLLKDNDVEAVIIALPLFLHHPVALEAMAAGKHVLSEKLMGHNIAQCKEMARAAEHTGLYLAVGHQRHYSVLYDNAVNLIRWNMLGEMQFIRAQWHRGNLPGNDGWKPYLPGGEFGPNGKTKIDKIADKLAGLNEKLAEIDAEAKDKKSSNHDDYIKLLRERDQWAAWDLDKTIADKAQDYGYQALELGGGRNRSAYEELCRWRLWDRTGGGLMAELGSHQLDAASIFVSALHGEGKHVHPLSVHGCGGRQVFPYDRDAEDHVYCMFQFPAPGYDAPEVQAGESYPDAAKRKYGFYDPFTGYPSEKEGIPGYDPDSNHRNKKITVTYSSIMGNSQGSYGEVVMGSKGTLMLLREQEALFQPTGESSTTRVKVKADKGKATMDSYETGGGPGPAAALGKAAEGPISRGYTEEIEHWAWCIRNPSPENQPKCTGPVAMGDAIMALVAKQAIANSGSDDPKVRAQSYIEYQDAWFDVHDDATPDGPGIEPPRSAEVALGKPYRKETTEKKA